MSKRGSGVTWVEGMAIFIIGGGLYLIYEHPLIFWFIALPLFLLIVGGIIHWIKN